MEDQRARENWYAELQARLEEAAAVAVRETEDGSADEMELRYASAVTEILRRWMITSGEQRAGIAVRVRDAGQLSFAKLGAIMGVTRARAAEIVGNGAEAAQALARAEVPEPQAVVAAIVTSRLGVLIGKRNDGKPPWTFIAGEIEPGESPADAAVREVKEETGLLVKHGKIIGERIHPKTGRHMLYMSATPVRGATDIFVGDEEELAEVRWVSLAEADGLMPGMFEPVRAYLERALR